MTRKLIALALSLLLLLSLAACGGNSAPAPAPDPTPASDPADTPDPALGPEDGQQPEDGQTPEDGQQPEDPADTAFRPGVVEDLTYTSDFFGLTAAMEEGWIIADEEQLAQLAGLVSDAFDSESLTKLLEDGAVVYDFYALNMADNSSVNVTVESLGRLGGILIDEDAYADANLKSLPDILAAAGITVDKLDKTTVDFAGAVRPALALEGSANGVPLFELMTFVKAGSYMACVTAAAYDETTPPASLLELFRAVEVETEATPQA
jgi:hypothetical protein